jgi:hypothetical protein
MGYEVENPSAVVVFPFFTKTKTTRILLEYMQGINAIRYVFPSGAYDSKKHSSRVDTAIQELSEEARLTGGTLIKLMPDDSLGIMDVRLIFFTSLF